MIWSNALNAFETLSNAADHRADDRKAVISDVDRQSSTRNQWSTIVDEARKLVGDRPRAEYESDLQQYLAANAGKWQATQECNPLEITRSKEFCAEVAKMQKLVSVAQQRDEHRAKIEALDTKLGLVTKPTHADPFVANVAAFLGVFGVKPLPESPEAIRSMKSLSRAVALEAMATFGPMMIFALFDGLKLAGVAVDRRVPALAQRAPA